MVFRFLLSGPGLMGKKHGQVILDRPDCELACVVGPPSERNRSFAQANKVELYPDMETALSHEKVDAAIISSPNPFHFSQAMSCIKRGIPALVEKPVTDNLADARELAEQSERFQVPILVGHHRTHSPLLSAADSFLKSPRFGRWVTIHGAALFYKPATYFAEGIWRTKKGGGPILINLIHEIGLFRYFCGEFKSIFALISKNIRNFEVEDTVSLAFEFQNGALGSFILSDTAASSKSWEMTSGENPSYPHFPKEYCYHFSGTNGSLDFPNLQARHYGQGVEPSWGSPFTEEHGVFTPGDPIALQLDHFTEVLKGNSHPKVSARDGYLNMRVIEAISRSIETRSIVDLDEMVD
ncbi:MAG: Gfo/Idh/MocA family oxidoreductase [Holophaga sp.]|nr:Gfo/Idh/MocA family oxidoreductase [Holophaga sp.]